MATIEFNGEFYNDDRLFVLHLCKSVTHRDDDGVEATTVFHDEAPPDHKWSVITFFNIPRYRACRVDNFDTYEEANTYFRGVEPTTPRISHGGRPSNNPPSFEQYSRWKSENGLIDYDIEAVYAMAPDDAKRQETFYSQR